MSLPPSCAHRTNNNFCNCDQYLINGLHTFIEHNIYLLILVTSVDFVIILENPNTMHWSHFHQKHFVQIFNLKLNYEKTVLSLLTTTYIILPLLTSNDLFLTSSGEIILKNHPSYGFVNFSPILNYDWKYFAIRFVSGLPKLSEFVFTKRPTKFPSNVELICSPWSPVN